MLKQVQHDESTFDTISIPSGLGTHADRNSVSHKVLKKEIEVKSGKLMLLK